MNLQHVIARRFAPVRQSYDWRDAALYALGLGTGDDPLDEDELPYVYEGRAELVRDAGLAAALDRRAGDRNRLDPGPARRRALPSAPAAAGPEVGPRGSS